MRPSRIILRSGDTSQQYGRIILPREAHPDFLVPGKKPVGPVVIDWAHPITRGLRFCFLGKGNDLVTGQPLTNNAGVKADNFGQGADLGSAGAESRAAYLVSNKPINRLNGTTVVARFTNWSGASNSWSVCGYHSSASPSTAGGHCIRHHWDGNTAVSACADQFSNYSTGNIFAYNNVIVTRKSPGDPFDLDIAAGSAYTSNTGLTGAAGSYSYFLAISESEVASGVEQFVYIFERYLSDAESALLRSDPYAFLKPANDIQVFYDPSAVEAPVTPPDRSWNIKIPVASKPIGK